MTLLDALIIAAPVVAAIIGAIYLRLMRERLHGEFARLNSPVGGNA